MSLWFLKLQSSKTVAYVPPPEDDEPRVHISQACLTPAYQGQGNVFVMMKLIEEESDQKESGVQEQQGSLDDYIVIAVLSQSSPQAGLDLVMDQYTEFYVQGPAEVHLSGYFMPDLVRQDELDDEDEDLLEDDIEEEEMNQLQLSDGVPPKSCVIEDLDSAPDGVIENNQYDNVKGQKENSTPVSSKTGQNQKRKQKKRARDESAPNNDGQPSKHAKNHNAALSVQSISKGQTLELPSGLQITQKQVGFDDGKQAVPGNKLRISYSARLVKNGKIIDKSKSFKFTLGKGDVISGMDAGCEGMRVGDERVILCPANLAYGAEGVKGTVPPNSAIQFEVALKDLK